MYTNFWFQIYDLKGRTIKTGKVCAACAADVESHVRTIYQNKNEGRLPIHLMISNFKLGGQE